MCGIVGILTQDNTAVPIDPARMAAALASLRHRGPDAEGFVDYHSVALGMTRLGIIDLATGDPPITNEDGSA